MSMRFEMSFVEFDQQGEPYPVGELDDPVKRKILPVLYDGDTWEGPVWKRDGKNNLVVIDEKELVRMHWYGFNREVPECTTERLEAGKKKVKFYTDVGGNKRPVPEVKGKCIFDIPLR
jgi:hypothetical protein